MKEEIILTNKEGKRLRYHILFSFEKNENKYTYIAYTDFSYEEDGNMRIYYGRYSKRDKSKIEQLDSQEEIDFMVDITKTFVEEMRKIN